MMSVIFCKSLNNGGLIGSGINENIALEFLLINILLMKLMLFWYEIETGVMQGILYISRCCIDENNASLSK